MGVVLSFYRGISWLDRPDSELIAVLEFIRKGKMDIPHKLYVEMRRRGYGGLNGSATVQEAPKEFGGTVVSFYKNNPYTLKDQYHLDRLVVAIVRGGTEPPHTLVVEGYRRIVERGGKHELTFERWT